MVVVSSGMNSARSGSGGQRRGRSRSGEMVGLHKVEAREPGLDEVFGGREGEEFSMWMRN